MWAQDTRAQPKAQRDRPLRLYGERRTQAAHTDRFLRYT
jgi:hypothetical protein